VVSEFINSNSKFAISVALINHLPFQLCKAASVKVIERALTGKCWLFQWKDSDRALTGNIDRWLHTHTFRHKPLTKSGIKTGSSCTYSPLWEGV